MPTSINIYYSLIGLITCLLAAAFFSSAETSMMSINRYKLKHLATKDFKPAIYAKFLLDRPDKLLGMILIGSTFASMLASSIATIFFIHLVGKAGVPIAAIIMTFIMLIFSEIIPKTIAAIHPERVVFAFSSILKTLFHLTYPIIYLSNSLSNNILKLFGIDVIHLGGRDALTLEELRSVVHGSDSKIAARDREMLLGILDLEHITVEDIMIPRNEILGINLDDDLDDILDVIQNSQQIRIVAYRTSLDNIVGILELGTALKFIAHNKLNKTMLESNLNEPYYIPDKTPIGIQIINFRKNKQRIGIVVDEYGNVQGALTIEEILEEIVGEFVVDINTLVENIHKLPDNSYIIDGTTTIREINKRLKWHLPIHGPRTLSGLIIECLEDIPDKNLCLEIEHYKIEVLSVYDHVIQTAKIYDPIQHL